MCRRSAKPIKPIKLDRNGNLHLHRFIGLALALAIFANLAQAQSLRGSGASMERQYRLALEEGLTFVRAPRQINALLENGELLRVAENRNMVLHDVSHPYARPGIKLLLDRLSAQYRAACGEKLIVTSLLRPQNRQPPNASTNSVHPAGMAVDLRIPPRGRCRSWLERVLLSLESSGVLDVTRERYPPHYHVAVFEAAYVNYVAHLTRSSGAPREYRVRRGDTLSQIARSMGVPLARLRAANGLSGDLITVGQRLQIPATAGSLLARQISYKVRRGDSLWRLAQRYGTSVARIKRQNGLRSDLLRINQVLQITPGQSS